MNISNRREFLKFLGASGITLSQLGAISSLTSCSELFTKSRFPNSDDNLVLIDGLKYYPLISWNDPINAKETFGFNNDFITYKTISNNELIMWVNHEYANPIFVSGIERTKENIDLERRAVGGSIIKVQKKDGKWSFIPNHELNRGVRADTKIPFANNVEVMGTNITDGTCSNCAGGFTPWGTFLTCEENSDKNYGERDKSTGKMLPTRFKWEDFYPNPIEHYQWVVEIEPETGKAQKHINLGRFAHESATTIISKSNHVVVYSGDDKEDEHVYKFVSKTKTDFNEGVLYVADLENSKWLPLDLELSPELKKHFKDHVELMINTRDAAKILGATPLNRPEDIEVHPYTGDVYISLTKNGKRGDYYGQILKIAETGADHSALTFKSETFLMGGELNKFACPDNLAFDKNGNLWFASDISGDKIGTNKYQAFGNNGLFVVPTKGDHAGEVIQIASAPKDAEFTGLSFSPDQKSLFLSVQHPGELTTDLNKPTSKWPSGKIPKPTVVVIEGDFLENLTKNNV